MSSINIRRGVNILVVGLLILTGSVFQATGFSSAVRAEAVRPLDPFCQEIADGNKSGIGNTGEQPEVCNQDAADKTADDKGLLAQGGIVDRVFKLISWLVGVLAIIFVILGGFKLTTSGGNKDSVKSARNMIIYAMVGLAVILLSNLIFNLIIGIVKGAS
jgi:hypothetical protein